LKSEGLPDSATKIGRELGMLGLPSKKRKEKGRQIMVREGIRRKRDDEE